MKHYCMNVPGGSWFLYGYEKLLNLLPKESPSRWVEIGVFHGQSLAFLGVEVLNRGLPVTIHAVDSFEGWPGVAQGQELRDSFDTHTAPIRGLLNGRFHVHAKRSVEAAADFADNSCDVVWIDADHSYEAVKADIAAWWPKLKAGGWMGGDDFYMAGVAQAVIEGFAPHYTLGHGWRNDPPEYVGPWPWWLVGKG